jgi:hypothetical protein
MATTNVMAVLLVRIIFLLSVVSIVQQKKIFLKFSGHQGKKFFGIFESVNLLETNPPLIPRKGDTPRTFKSIT